MASDLLILQLSRQPRPDVADIALPRAAGGKSWPMISVTVFLTMRVLYG